MTVIQRATSPITTLGTATLVGAAAGALTTYLQGVLPADWSTLANSGALWCLVAVAVAAGLAQRRGEAIAAGLLALLAEVVGYYVFLADVRHIAAASSEVILWTMAALWIGPLTGLAGFAARWGTAEQRTLALAAVAGVLAGEGAYLVRLAGLPRSGWVELVLAAVLTVAALAATPVHSRHRLLALTIGAVVAGAVYVAYGSRLLG
jgi:Family of unknown function (DUF6518)